MSQVEPDDNILYTCDVPLCEYMAIGRVAMHAHQCRHRLTVEEAWDDFLGRVRESIEPGVTAHPPYK